MAIIYPRCSSEFDAKLIQFANRVRCRRGVEIEYPGTDQPDGHFLAKSTIRPCPRRSVQRLMSRGCIPMNRTMKAAIVLSPQ